MIDVLAAFLDNTLALFLDAAPWLVLGLAAAGLIKAWIPEGAMNRWLGGKGTGPVLKAAIVGAPLPLCSCGVVPAAIGLKRAGASPGATVSFLVATPETGIDSVAVTYALMGPFMTVVRPVAAILSAITAGLLAGQVKPAAPAPTSRFPLKVAAAPACDGTCCGTTPAAATRFSQRTVEGLRYAATDLVRDIAPWMTAGLLVAGAIVTAVPPDTLAEWGRGPLAYLIMLLVGIPMYICATASTPLAAALLVAGVSPGAVLVFLLAGPATNAATIALLRRELGQRVTVAYLAGIALSSLVLGLLTDLAVDAFAIDIRAQLAAVGEGGAGIVAWGSALLLTVLAMAPLARRLGQRMGSPAR